MHGKMWSWQEWSESAETTLDLSYEANELGLIPLECPCKFSVTHRQCKAKLFNAPQKKKIKGKDYQLTRCLLCGCVAWRKIGLKKK